MAQRSSPKEQLTSTLAALTRADMWLPGEISWARGVSLSPIFPLHLLVSQPFVCSRAPRQCVCVCEVAGKTHHKERAEVSGADSG